jgi:uncharacterized protein YbbC (DUF1343 family)
MLDALSPTSAIRLLISLVVVCSAVSISFSQKSTRPVSSDSHTVLTGIDVLQRDDFQALRGKSIGLITNHTGVNSAGVSTVKLLHEASDVDLQVLFSPEHGFAGKLDQRIIGDARDEETNLKIFSLYGQTRTPPRESLADLDTLVFDIQDIGTRFYTYISTMGNAMHAAAAQDVAFVVLDRPNPINGLDVAGPVLDDGLQSFVGYHTIAVQHGMTVGEIARMIKAEQQLDLDLTVVPVENWHRGDFYDATGLMWINPSPNMRNLNEAVLYPGIGLLETTNLSVGRGTDTPFEILGAPWIDGRRLAARLNQADLPGVVFVPIQFLPESSKFAGEPCQGVNIVITRRDRFRGVRTGLTIAAALRQEFPENWDTTHFNRLLADEGVYRAVLDGHSVERIEASYQDELDTYRQRREKFLLY